MIIEHYTQTIDLGENVKIEGTLDYSINEVNIHLIAWKDGRQTHEIKTRYNIMYDYERWQQWWNGQLIKDALEGGYGYGRPMYEERNKVKWKDNFEPVSPYGCEAYQTNCWRGFVKLPENRIGIVFLYSPYGEDGILKTGKIFKTKEIDDDEITHELKWLEKYKREFDPIKARESRLKFFTEKDEELNMTYSEWLQTEVPIDMSMVD